ncbi:hypothetical protein CPHO_02495 [Corynebacterium phocae]|uniref:DUF2993 domain-containing protein n=1 Tax=Corynebacterium phocae TaxID=161895 RepID=A0A1L7D689_9CORY|nr:hypothetical protein CPHO_02495 [Corynebacterium phocae]
MVAAVAGLSLVFLGDTAAAINAERQLAARTREASNLEATPATYIGGFPYLGALVTGQIPLVEVHALDVEVPELGLVNAATVLRDVDVSTAQVWSGDFSGASASTLSRSISLDGVALGRLLGMDDISISNPKNISPSGGQSAEAELTGTIPGDETPTTVEVSLRLEGAMFYMRPDTTDQRIAEAFSYQVDTRRLPLPARATKVSMRGGTISFEVQRREVTLRDRSLSPLEIDGHFDEAGRITGEQEPQ